MGDSDTERPAAAVNAFFRQHHKQHIVCLRCIKVFDPTKSAARNHPHLHCGSPTEEEDPDEVMLEVADFARAKSKKHAHDIATKLIGDNVCQSTVHRVAVCVPEVSEASASSRQC